MPRVGIGACSKALERLGIEHEIVDAVEIDKYAITSFNAIHGTNFEVQDITKYDKDLEADLIMHGSPCQDFSVAGRQAGGDVGSGTRSSLMYETIRIVGKIKPKYVVWENVKNLLSKKHKHNFDAYIETMNILGYNSYYQVLNAKDYGIPQNRERIFTISIRKDIDDKSFTFPKKEELKLRLKDMLEEQVDEKYYLSDTQIENFKFNNNGNCNPSGKGMNGQVYSGDILPTLTTNKGEGLKINETNIIGSLNISNWHELTNRVYNIDSYAPTIHAMEGGNIKPKILIKNNTKKGYLEAYPGDGVYTNITTKRGTVQPQTIQTITTLQDKGVVLDDLKIRKLTPKECWRLMGFDDKDFEKAKEHLNNKFYKGKDKSNSQLYKQAGNSICVSVLEKIFKNLL